MSDPATRLNAALEGRYRIERELGEGGMATVYLADDLRHQRRVAVKVLKPELAAVVGAERFLAEITTTANLQHPHILPLHDSGEADGFLYYVMPYVEGETLRDRLERERQLPVDEAVRDRVPIRSRRPDRRMDRTRPGWRRHPGHGRRDRGAGASLATRWPGVGLLPGRWCIHSPRRRRIRRISPNRGGPQQCAVG